MLGNGSISTGSRAKNATLRISHLSDPEDFVDLEKPLSIVPVVGNLDGETGGRDCGLAHGT